MRLKGGDPLLFGRAGEEIAALRQAGVEFEIVPGITAGFGAAAAAGFSLTDRRVASQVLFTTIQRDTDNRSIQWGGISSTTTLVLYMPGTDYARVMQQLRDAGWPDDMPCAIVSHASGKGSGDSLYDPGEARRRRRAAGAGYHGRRASGGRSRGRNRPGIQDRIGIRRTNLAAHCDLKRRRLLTPITDRCR